MKVYGDNSLRLRAAKLAARPKCGHRWATEQRTTGRSDPWQHECAKFKGHAQRDHKCECGAFSRKKPIR